MGKGGRNWAAVLDSKVLTKRSPSLKPPCLFKTYTEGPTAAPGPLRLCTANLLTVIDILCHLDRESFLDIFESRRSRPRKSLLLFCFLEVQTLTRSGFRPHCVVSTPRWCNPLHCHTRRRVYIRRYVIISYRVYYTGSDRLRKVISTFTLTHASAYQFCR